MAKIYSLDSSLVDQIAAGEVIDRPASVVKELIENSLDSGANTINVKINNGGHELILINDNGCGMDHEDLKLAFERHATSKIKILKDLSSIQTLGFRGEALPSIASVSMFTAISAANDNNAYELIINGGDFKSYEPTAGLVGTTCKVQNLFYNTPARRKFLKKPKTERLPAKLISNKYLRYFNFWVL